MSGTLVTSFLLPRVFAALSLLIVALAVLCAAMGDWGLAGMNLLAAGALAYMSHDLAELIRESRERAREAAQWTRPVGHVRLVKPNLKGEDAAVVMWPLGGWNPGSIPYDRESIPYDRETADPWHGYPHGVPLPDGVDEPAVT